MDALPPIEVYIHTHARAHTHIYLHIHAVYILKSCLYVAICTTK
jgi:hypothetical protein